MAVVTEIHSNFRSALAACGDGYGDADLADVIAFKTALPIDKTHLAPEQAINTILSIGIAAAGIAHRPLTVLDFGGGCGFHYFRVQPLIAMPLQWALVETPKMAERAVKVAQGRFSVYTEIAEAAKALGRIDLVHASSSIQYVPDPLATLRALAALQARYITLARFPLWRGAPIVGVQISTLAGNGIGPMPPNIADRELKYPVTFTNIDDVLRALNDYEVDLVVASPSAEYGVLGQNVPGVTVIFRAKERTTQKLSEA